MANRTKTVVATASRIIENHGRRISTKTARNCLKAAGLRAKSPHVGTRTIISDQNGRRRLPLARRHIRTTRAGWTNFIQRLRKLPRRRYLVELRRDIVNVWNKFPERLLQKCINSMRH